MQNFGQFLLCSIVFSATATKGLFIEPRSTFTSYPSLHHFRTIVFSVGHRSKKSNWCHLAVSKLDRKIAAKSNFGLFSTAIRKTDIFHPGRRRISILRNDLFHGCDEDFRRAKNSYIPPTATIQLSQPCCVSVKTLTYIYPPPNIFSFLFSPIKKGGNGNVNNVKPALSSLSIELSSTTSPTILVGSSGCGKSSLLKCIASSLDPYIAKDGVISSGEICINNVTVLPNPNDSLSFLDLTPRPIFIEEKGLSWPASNSAPPQSRVLEWVTEAALFQITDIRGTNLKNTLNIEQSTEIGIFSKPKFQNWCEKLAMEYCSICGLTEGDYNTPIQSLSRSKVHLVKLAIGAVQSVSVGIFLAENINTTSCTRDTPADAKATSSKAMKLPKYIRPIILLDEVYDTEISSVTSVVAQGIERLCTHGAVVVISTHVPEPFLHSKVAKRIVSMTRGIILSDQKLL